MPMWRSRRGNKAPPTQDSSVASSEQEVIDLRERLRVESPAGDARGSGTTSHAAGATKYAAWYREAHGVSEVPGRGQTPPGAQTVGGTPAVEQRPVSDTDPEPVHDTSKCHDTNVVHDMTRVHDTSRVHGAPAGARPTAPVSTPDGGSDDDASIDGRVDVPDGVRSSPGMQTSPDAVTPASGFSERERRAWRELDDELSRATRLLQREIDQADQPPVFGLRAAPTGDRTVKEPTRSATPETSNRPTSGAPTVGPGRTRPGAVSPPPQEAVGAERTRPGPASPPTPRDTVGPSYARAVPGWRAAVVVGALALVAFAFVLAALRIGGPADAPVDRRTVSSGTAGAARPADVNALAAWLARSTDKGTRVVAPSGLLEQLRTALPGRKVTRVAQARPGVLVVHRAGQRPNDQASTTRPAEVSEVVARFPSGFTVRQLGLGGREARVDRSDMSRRLLADTDVRLTPRAWRRLAEGDVDPRLLGLLGRVARKHTIDVAAFPRDARERAAGAPARTMRVTAIDGLLVGDAEPDIQQLRALLLSQPGDVSPDSVTARRAAEPPVLVVRVLLPSTTS
jgi:hypothetical protein